MTDASLTVFEGRTVRGVLIPALRKKHKNWLELLTVFLALKHFVDFLKNRS